MVNQYRAAGWIACRSAGSHSPYDVWAYNPKTGDVELTQIKTKIHGRNEIIKTSKQEVARNITLREVHYE